MTVPDFDREISSIYQDKDIHVESSADFQCDQSDGYPVSLECARELGKVWLMPSNTVSGYSKEEQAAAFKLCAAFGIRQINSREDYENLRKELGRDAMDSIDLLSDYNEGGLEFQ